MGLGSLMILSIDLGTELGPAISVRRFQIYVTPQLAYEKSEDDIMNRPPRSKKDRLVSANLLLYCYLQAGIIQALWCLIAYFLVFLHYGISIKSLAFSTDDYWSSTSPDLVASNGNVYNADDQLRIVSGL